jgi:hypothetical protein
MAMSLGLVVAGGLARADDYTVDIAPGLQSRFTAEEIVDRITRSGAGSGVRRVTAVRCARAADVGMRHLGPDALLWIVHVEGRFVNLRTPLGCPAQVASKAFHVISDATGEVVAWGLSGGRFRGPCDFDRLRKGR